MATWEACELEPIAHPFEGGGVQGSRCSPGSGTSPQNCHESLLPKLTPPPILQPKDPAENTAFPMGKKHLWVKKCVQSRCGEHRARWEMQAETPWAAPSFPVPQAEIPAGWGCSKGSQHLAGAELLLWDARRALSSTHGCAESWAGLGWRCSRLCAPSPQRWLDVTQGHLSFQPGPAEPCHAARLRLPHLGTVFAVCLQQLVPAGALGRCQALTDMCPSSLAAGMAQSSGSPREGQAGTSPSCVLSVGSLLTPERASGCPRACCHSCPIAAAFPQHSRTPLGRPPGSAGAPGAT